MQAKQLLFAIFLVVTGTHVATAADESSGQPLPNWLVGIVAVACFLVLAFAFLLFNHYVCEQFYEKEEDYESELEEGTSASNTCEDPSHMEPGYRNESFYMSETTSL